MLPLLACERRGAAWPHVKRVGGWAPLRGRTQEAMLPLLACERRGAAWPHVGHGRAQRAKGGWVGRADTAKPWPNNSRKFCSKKNGRHEEKDFSMLPQNNLFTFYGPFCQVLASARGVLSIEQHLRVFSLLPKYASAILLNVVNTQVVVKFAIVFVCLDFKECSDVFS